MKKLFCFVLSLLILLSAFPASALTYSEKIDAAFDSGHPQLSETESVTVKPQASDFEFTDEAKALLEEAEIGDIDAALAERLQNTEFLLISKSPSGNSGLVSAGKTAVTFYNGKYHYVYPSAKGAADEYSNLEQYYTAFSTSFDTLLGEEGVVYSPDGKYAFICNSNITLMRMKLFIDPILLDLSTGELILTATYPDDLKKDDHAGAVTSAMFSSDHQYFYYVLYGRFGEARIRLNRYNLSTGETETCFTSEKMMYLPHIAELDDGSILLLGDIYGKEGTQFLVIASFSNGTWVLKEEEIKLPRHLFYASRLICSSKAGLVCLAGNPGSLAGLGGAFQLIRPENNFDGIDQFWCIQKVTNELASFSPEEYQKLAEPDAQNEGKRPIAQYRTILNAVFSPDGRYLLLNTANSAEKNLFLLRLEDMTVQEVSGQGEGNIIPSPMARDYPANFEWNTDELIITTDEGIKTFTFTDGQ